MKILPNGYTQLEYIESSGTQYIDTGIIPEVGHTAEIAFQSVTTPSLCWIFGECQSGGAWRAGFVAGAFHTNGGFTYSQTSSTTGYTVANGACASNLDNSVYLFAGNEGGAIEFGSFKLFYCKIYDENDKLVRDYIPCINSSGTAGLYDLVNDVFYGNAGTGTFIAGPEIPNVNILPPEDIVAPYTDFANVLLIWSASAGATGYNIKRNGVLVATVQSPVFIDIGLDKETQYSYSVTAFNNRGESEEVLINAETTDFKLITDRTSQDVQSVTQAIRSGVLPDNWFAGMKGAYNATDFNRVEQACAYLLKRFLTVGYNLTRVIKTWSFNDFPAPQEMQRYLGNVRYLRSILPVLTAEAPSDMDRLTYEEANDIEKILFAIDEVITKISLAWYYSGDLYAGEV